MTQEATFPADLEARFRPLRPLGRGAMGEVWLAQDLQTGTPVALKLLAGVTAAGLIQRLQREAAVLAQLRHPGVLRLLGMGTCSRGPFLATEYLEGESLEGKVLEPGRAEAVMLEVAAALQAVHDAGLLHRDLKPANVFLTRQGRAKLIDFGLALDPDLTRLTATSVFVGTPLYMAPEVWRGHPSSVASDWYSWGATGFELVEGRAPVDHGVVEWAQGLRDFPRAPLKLVEPGSPLGRALEACLAVDPEQRPRGLEEIRARMRGGDPSPSPGATTGALRPLEDSAPEAPAPAGRGRGGALVAPALVALALVALGAAWRAGPPPPPVAASPPTASPAAPAGPLPVDLVARLRRELEWARGRAVTPGGELIEEGIAGERDRRLLDRDPATWGQTVALMPELASWYAWRRQGRDPSEIPEVQRSQLRALDPEYARVLGERPFFPVLYATPSSEPMVALAGVGFQRLPPPPRPAYRGWAGTALGAAARCMQARRVKQQEFDAKPEGPLEGGTVVSIGGFLTKMSVSDYLNGISGDRFMRIRTREWVDDGRQELLLGLYAARRALEDPRQADRDYLGLVLSEVLGSQGALMSGGEISLDPEANFGGGASHPATWHLFAELRYKALVRLTNAGFDPDEEWATLPALYQLALEGDDAEPWVSLRKSFVLARLTKTAGRRASREVMAMVVQEHLDFLSRMEPHRQLALIENLLEFMVEEEAALGLDAAGLERLAAIAAPVAARGGARLKAYLRRFRERFGGPGSPTGSR